MLSLILKDKKCGKPLKGVIMKVASFFAGVGGIELGFKQAGFNTIWANEIDVNASVTYKANFRNVLIIDDIKNIEPKQIPDFDILLAGFPCQSFSLAGYRKGFEDERGNLFFEIIRIIKKKKPSIVFLENVKNLVGHDRGNTFRVILEALKINGYVIKSKVLNACEYGNIPQNRERIYIVAFLDKKKSMRFDFPEPIMLSKKLSDLIDFDEKKDSKFYYTDKNCSFYDRLYDEINKIDTIYQWRRQYVRENKSNLCPTLTANMGTGGHNVPIIYTKHGIRKLTPRECFNIQGFDKDFIIPECLSNTSLYKQAGNSVTVTVIKSIADRIAEAIS